MPVAEALDHAAVLGLPVGWDNDPLLSTTPPGGTVFWMRLASKVVGLLITTAAASLGAPFWFDLIQKLVPLRAAGAKPPKTL